jgi:hypothetical protein
MLGFIKSQKGNNLQIFEEYLFSIHQKSEEKIIWRGTDYKRKNCLTRYYTITDDESGLLIYDYILGRGYNNIYNKYIIIKYKIFNIRFLSNIKLMTIVIRIMLVRLFSIGLDIIILYFHIRIVTIIINIFVGEFLGKRGDHEYAPDTTELESKKVIERIKKASDSNQTTRNIISEAFSQSPMPFGARLPSIVQLLRLVEQFNVLETEIIYLRPTL